MDGRRDDEGERVRRSDLNDVDARVAVGIDGDLPLGLELADGAVGVRGRQRKGAVLLRWGGSGIVVAETGERVESGATERGHAMNRQRHGQENLSRTPSHRQDAAWV